MLPLFDGVPAAPRRDGPVRTQEGKSPPTAHTTARLSAALDGDDRPKSHRPATLAPHGSVLYFAYWTAFKRGADGQSPPGVEHDEEIARYAAAGFNTGKIVGDIRKQARARGERESRERRRW